MSDDTKRLIEKGLNDSVTIGSYDEIRLPDVVGNGDVAIVTTGNEKFFVKRYAGTLDWYDNRDLLFDLDVNQWDGDEKKGGGAYEFWALKTAFDASRHDDGSFHIPEPIEYIDSHNLIVMEYIDGLSNLRNNLHPYSARKIYDHLTRDKSYWLNLVEDLARLIHVHHRKTRSDDESVDVSEYVEIHQAYVARKEMPAALAEGLSILSDCRSPRLVGVQTHGDYTPRNVLRDRRGRYVLVDWTLSIKSHPLIDVHRFALDLWRWSHRPFTSSKFYRKLMKSFVNTYLDVSRFTRYEFLFTKVTALVRFYYWYITNKTGLVEMVNARLFEKEILAELEATVRDLTDHDSSG